MKYKGDITEINPQNSHLQAFVPQTVQLCLVSAMLILQVSLGLLRLSTQGFHLQHQNLPLSAQHQQLPLRALCLTERWMEPVIKPLKNAMKILN